MEVKNALKKLLNKFSASDKILVTGGLGYIGSHTVVELMDAGYDVYVIDDLINSNIDTLNNIERITGKRPIFENIDCSDYVALDKFLSKYEDIIAIIHLAALKDVRDSVLNPLPYYRNNVVSLVNLLELMPIHKITNLILSSSCTVYGQPAKLPVDESAPFSLPLSPYAYTKQIVEKMLTDTLHARINNEELNLKSIILRYFNPIGSHSSSLLGEIKNEKDNAGLIPIISQTAAGIYKKVEIYGKDYNTPDGTCIRDYISVVDVAKAHVAAIKRICGDDGSEMQNNVEVYNLGMGKGYSVLEMIEKYEEVNNVKVPYEFVDRREGEIEQIWADIHAAQKMLKWKPKVTIEEILRSAWNWQLYVMKKEEDTYKPASHKFFSGS